MLYNRYQSMNNCQHKLNRLRAAIGRLGRGWTWSVGRLVVGFVESGGCGLPIAGK